MTANQSKSGTSCWGCGLWGVSIFVGLILLSYAGLKIAAPNGDINQFITEKFKDVFAFDWVDDAEQTKQALAQDAELTYPAGYALKGLLSLKIFSIGGKIYFIAPEETNPSENLASETLGKDHSAFLFIHTTDLKTKTGDEFVTGYLNKQNESDELISLDTISVQHDGKTIEGKVFVFQDSETGSRQKQIHIPLTSRDHLLGIGPEESFDQKAFDELLESLKLKEP